MAHPASTGVNMPGSFRSWALVLTAWPRSSLQDRGAFVHRIRRNHLKLPRESSPLLATSIDFFNRGVPNVIRGTMPKVGSTFKIAMRS